MAARVDLKYESDLGTVHKLSVDPETATAVGTEPAGAIDSDVRPKISKANTEFGIRPRAVRLSRTIGTAPDTFKRYKTLPVLTATEWSSATFAVGVQITIGGIIWTIIGRLPEDY